MTARNAVFFLVICALVCIGPQSATRAAAAHLKRLLHPLTGSTTWVEYDGVSTVHNPESRQWSLNFSNSASGTMATPSIGEFRNGRGDFIDQKNLGSRADDGGKTWEVNWVADDTLEGTVGQGTVP